MKKLFCLLLALLVFPFAAQGAEKERIIPLGDDFSRVKLRAAPSGSAQVLGQYFDGVPVDVLSAEGAWAHVSIAGREGYMMRDFLEPATGPEPFPGLSGFVRFPDADGATALYAAPDAGAEVLARIPAESVVVLGTVGQDFLHVSLNGMTGFVSSSAVSQTDNFAAVTVDTGSADGMLNLRARPDKSGERVAQLYGGVTLYVLFDDHVAYDGWERVRVGNAEGYVMADFLSYSSAGAEAYLPPLGTVTAETPLFASADGSTETALLPAGETVSVLGKVGSRLLVQHFTEDETLTGFADAACVRHADASVSTQGRLKADATLQTLTRDGTLEPFEPLKAGTTVYLLYSRPADDPGGRISAYILPGSLVCVEAQLPSGAWVSGYVPADVLDFAPGLSLPKNF